MDSSNNLIGFKESIKTMKTLLSQLLDNIEKANQLTDAEDMLNETIENYINSILIKTNGIQQHDDNWYKTRVKFIGGSEIAAIELKKYYKLKELLEKKIGLSKSDFTGILPLNWGNLFEDMMNSFIEHHFDTKVHGDSIYIYDDNQPTSYSPDGIAVIDKSSIVLLEYKSPISRKLDGKVPEDYLCQVKAGLKEIKMCDYGLYCEGVFRMCSIDEWGFNGRYNDQLHDSCNKGCREDGSKEIIKFNDEDDLIIKKEEVNQVLCGDKKINISPSTPYHLPSCNRHSDNRFKPTDVPIGIGFVLFYTYEPPVEYIYNYEEEYAEVQKPLKQFRELNYSKWCGEGVDVSNTDGNTDSDEKLSTYIDYNQYLLVDKITKKYNHKTKTLCDEIHDYRAINDIGLYGSDVITKVLMEWKNQSRYKVHRFDYYDVDKKLKSFDDIFNAECNRLFEQEGKPIYIYHILPWKLMRIDMHKVERDPLFMESNESKKILNDASMLIKNSIDKSPDDKEKLLKEFLTSVEWMRKSYGGWNKNNGTNNGANGTNNGANSAGTNSTKTNSSTKPSYRKVVFDDD